MNRFFSGFSALIKFDSGKRRLDAFSAMLDAGRDLRRCFRKSPAVIFVTYRGDFRKCPAEIFVAPGSIFGP